MVQEVPCDIVTEDEDETRLGFRIPKTRPEPVPSKRAELADAFQRFAKQSPRLSFARCLAKWVDGRRQGNFPVDDDDPDAVAPSQEFESYLRMRFKKLRQT